MDAEAMAARMNEMSDTEHSEFERVEHKRHHCRDIHAFLLLDSLVPCKYRMVSAAEHDIIYLETDPEQLAAVATEENLLDLVRCGVFVDEETDSLAMFA